MYGFWLQHRFGKNKKQQKEKKEARGEDLKNKTCGVNKAL